MPREGLWVTSTTFFRVEAVVQSGMDIASEWFDRVAQPGDSMGAQEDVALMGMLLIVRHRLPE